MMLAVSRYYDLTNSLCTTKDAGPFAENWAVTSGINGGIPKCEQWASTNAKSLAKLGTNRIVGTCTSSLLLIHVFVVTSVKYIG